MSDKKLELLRALEAMWDRYPEWRFGQMVANLSYWAVAPTVEAIWDVEDAQLLKTIQVHLAGPKRAGDHFPPSE